MDATEEGRQVAGLHHGCGGLDEVGKSRRKTGHTVFQVHRLRQTSAGPPPGQRSRPDGLHQGKDGVCAQRVAPDLLVGAKKRPPLMSGGR